MCQCSFSFDGVVEEVCVFGGGDGNTEPIDRTPLLQHILGEHSRTNCFGETALHAISEIGVYRSQ